MITTPSVNRLATMPSPCKYTTPPLRDRTGRRHYGRSGVTTIIIAALLAFAPATQGKPRARDLGIPFDGTTGPLNAITDVGGVEVGHTTLNHGQGPLHIGKGPVRTGVTAIWPRGKRDFRPVFGGWFALNGNGEMTGTTWVEESGWLEGPVVTTNTYSVGTARDAILAWLLKHRPGAKDPDDDFGALPVVAETWGSALNDIRGFHVKQEHVFAALDGATSGPVAEGNVGGGTGMILFDFKGGMGTASRRLPKEARGYTVGVLAQCNFGDQDQLLIAGVAVGRELDKNSRRAKKKSSIIVVLATDAPLLPHQLKRLAKRASHGVARTGGISENSSGDIFIAFSTANAKAARPKGVAKAKMLANEELDKGLFAAAAQATEEAIINTLVAADDMTDFEGKTVAALPCKKVQEVLKPFNRLEKGK